MPESLFGYRCWFWRSGYFWERGITFRREDYGFSVGIQWPPIQRIGWKVTLV